MATQPMNAGSDSTPAQGLSQAPKLLERLWSALTARRYRAETVGRFTEWNRQFILFHGKRHPETMGRVEIEQYLTHLAQAGHGAELQAEARQAVAFLYREILGQALPWPEVGRMRPEGSVAGGPPKLLERMCEIMRARGYSSRTEECYVMWARRYILFHNKRHPLEMGGREIEEFLTDLVVKGHVSASTQAQGLNALLFLYQQVLEVELALIRAVRSQRPRRLPVVMSRGEVRQVLEAIEGYGGLYALMARLLYGTGMRLFECCGLRVKDMDLTRNQILVRQGKGDKDRVVMLPRALRPSLEQQFEQRRIQHEKDLARGIAQVPLPDALARKYPSAVRELGWQFLFASRQLSRDPLSGKIGRFHVYDNTHVMEQGAARTASPLDDLDAGTNEELLAAVAATRGLAGSGGENLPAESAGHYNSANWHVLARAVTSNRAWFRAAYCE